MNVQELKLDNNIKLNIYHIRNLVAITTEYVSPVMMDYLKKNPYFFDKIKIQLDTTTRFDEYSFSIGQFDNSDRIGTFVFHSTKRATLFLKELRRSLIELCDVLVDNSLQTESEELNYQLVL